MHNTFLVYFVVSRALVRKCQNGYMRYKQNTFYTIVLRAAALASTIAPFCLPDPDHNLQFGDVRRRQSELRSLLLGRHVRPASTLANVAIMDGGAPRPAGLCNKHQLCEQTHRCLNHLKWCQTLPETLNFHLSPTTLYT